MDLAGTSAPDDHRGHDGARMPMTRRRSLERPEKILLAMLHLSKGTTQPLKYEDIVVKAFAIFPEEFALRGYPQFPDSSDIHKPLYGVLKRGGMVRAANKTFALTQRGVETARRLSQGATGTPQSASAERMSRDVRSEIDRMINSPAYQLFAEARSANILDTDFYNFIGCTARTPLNDFIGRVRSADAAIAEALRLGQPDPAIAAALGLAWRHLQEHFKSHIDRRSGRKPGVSRGSLASASDNSPDFRPEAAAQSD